MLDATKALSSFSVNDIQKAKDFYGKTLRLDVSPGSGNAGSHQSQDYDFTRNRTTSLPRSPS